MSCLVDKQKLEKVHIVNEFNSKKEGYREV